MKNFLLMAVAFFLNLSHFSFAQTLHELGVGLTTEKDQRLLLNYNMSTKRKFKLNFRLSQGWNIDEEHVSSEIVTTASNESRAEIFWNQKTVLQSKFFVGPEFQIKESNFSWGIEAVLGYRLDQYELTKYTHGVYYISTDPVMTSVIYPAEKSELWVLDNSHSMTTGINGRISLKAVATKRIGIRVFAELGLDYSIRVNRSVYEAEPPTQEPELLPGQVRITFPKNYFIPRARLGASIFMFR
jgi:hypothetical protein